MSYCGTQEVVYLSQVAYDQLNFSSDALFGSYISGTLIPEAQKFIDSYCHHQFGSVRGTLNFDGDGRKLLFLPPEYCPPLAVHAGSVGATAISTVSDLKLHEQYIEWDGSTFTEGELNVELDMSYGYEDVPADIQYITAQISANVLNDMVRRRMTPDVMVQLGGADQSAGGGLKALFSQPAVLPPTLRDLLEDYKIRWVEMG